MDKVSSVFRTTRPKAIITTRDIKITLYTCITVYQLYNSDNITKSTSGFHNHICTSDTIVNSNCQNIEYSKYIYTNSAMVAYLVIVQAQNWKAGICQ